ncbi:hypothetical protein CEXT_309391 [Caerostris extrusa]|uniref:Uncharacterized protein n=1 Tax=Caerostris extrusa TaxID=172846 RepID=A0AAV4P1K8_CAEEX|nr:hypothetical protein CEXT_309391 [Caerostris extrusa]
MPTMPIWRSQCHAQFCESLSSSAKDQAHQDWEAPEDPTAKHAPKALIIAHQKPPPHGEASRGREEIFSSSSHRSHRNRFKLSDVPVAPKTPIGSIQVT